MVKATLRRRINKVKAQKRSSVSKPTSYQNIHHEPQNTQLFTDANGFQLVLTKKERALMKKAQMEECAEDVENSTEKDVHMGNDADPFEGAESVTYSDDGLDTQSTISKSWVRKQLKQSHAGGISRPSCKKRQRDMFRRVLLYTQLHSHAKPNARGQIDLHSKLTTIDSTTKTPLMEGVDPDKSGMQFVSQWAQFSSIASDSETNKPKWKKKNRKAKKCSAERETVKSTVNPESVVPFRKRAKATSHAISAFQTMLQKF